MFLFKVVFESKSDGSEQSHKIHAHSIPEALRQFSKMFPDVRIIRCVKEF